VVVVDLFDVTPWHLISSPLSLSQKTYETNQVNLAREQKNAIVLCLQF